MQDACDASKVAVLKYFPIRWIKIRSFCSESLSKIFTSIKFEKLTSYFHFVIYFTKNMNQLVYNEEIKSYDLHTIYF